MTVPARHGITFPFDGIPLLGVSKWPLDFFWNRSLKRAEDIAGAIAGLLIFSLPILIAAIAVKASSRGPVFYLQERCGEKGRRFRIWKLRSMRQRTWMLMLGMALLGATRALLLAPWIMPLVYGERFGAAVPLLQTPACLVPLAFAGMAGNAGPCSHG